MQDWLRRLTHLLVPVGIVGGLVMLGCASADMANVTPGQLAPCDSDADCFGGALCVARVCVPPGVEAPRTFSMELDPPEVSGYTRTQFLDQDLATLFSGAPLSLPIPNEYETVVLGADNEPVSARVTLYGADRIPGREADVSTTIAANSTQRPVLRLLEGEYLVRLHPTNTELPATEVRRFTVRGEGGSSVKEFKLPATYRRLYGEVTSSVQSAEKIAGVTVRAFAQKTGLLSTTSVSDEYGRYELLLPASEDTIFVLKATPPAALQPAWGYQQVVAASADFNKQISLEPTDASIRGEARIQVLGTTSEGRLGAPVANAFVSLTATVAGVREPPVFELTGTTDNDGVLVVDVGGEVTSQVPLLKAKYVVRVTPPVNTPYTSQVQVLDLTSAGQGFLTDEQITLPQRTRVRGSVVSRLGRPVQGAFIDLRPLTADARFADALSGSDGTFSVDLDPGRYLLVVRPQNPSGAEELLPVSARVLEVAEGQALDLAPFTLHLGRQVRAQVTGGWDAAPLAVTQVEMFFSQEGQVVSLGRTETDAAGWFTLVVPVAAE